MSFVTRRLASASVTLTSQPLAGDARSVSPVSTRFSLVKALNKYSLLIGQATGTSPTAGNASVMDTRTLVIPRLGSASTAGTPPWESSAMSARSAYWPLIGPDILASDWSYHNLTACNDDVIICPGWLLRSSGVWTKPGSLQRVSVSGHPGQWPQLRRDLLP